MLLYKQNIYYLLVFLFLGVGFQAFSQDSTISVRKKMRYLKKIERKNDRYVKQQERKTHRLLSKLSRKEKALLNDNDSVKLDSSLVKGNFSHIQGRLLDNTNNPDQILANGSQAALLQKNMSINTMPGNLNSDIKDYLKQQFITSSFLIDTNCIKCEKLKKESKKAKENIAKTSRKLERIKSAEADIKKHQETLKNYGIRTPELAGKIKEINKDCYYYMQGMNGFKDIYTNPAKGIENSLLKNLSLNKDFKIFQGQMSTIPLSTSSLNTSVLTGNAMPDMTGYQTKAQVQAMLPQNASGITPDAKLQLISNMQNGLNKFTELRDEKPDLSMLKDKPDFKVNPFKGLPLRKRFIPGITFQPQIKKLNEPFIIDMGLTLGFKLSDRLMPMIGASTKVGFGKDIHNIALSYQGVVVRAGFDTKLFYGFSIQGWYEATWKPLPDKFTETPSLHYPQPSLIAGICNTYKISKKVNGTLMIGYDFFYNKHIPYTSPWVIRMGWQ
jgi:hypothetical protein